MSELEQLSVEWKASLDNLLKALKDLRQSQLEEAVLSEKVAEMMGAMYGEMIKLVAINEHNIDERRREREVIAEEQKRLHEIEIKKMQQDHEIRLMRSKGVLKIIMIAVSSLIGSGGIIYLLLSK